MTEKSSEELASSDLGTLEYWEKAYSLEINNFEDHKDVGEVWFGNDSSARVIRFVNSQLKLPKDTTRIIDLGCGNGMFLVDLARSGYKKLTGVDYSPKAIDLAKKVLQDEELPEVELHVHDIVESPGSDVFEVAHDKGTYDAISLHPEDPKGKRQRYIQNVYKILTDRGFLALTSCNWTKQELVDHFSQHFELAHEIPQKKFSFGGQTGNAITQLIFVKKCLKLV